MPHDHCRAADLNLLNLTSSTRDARVQRGRASDLSALGDLDFFTECKTTVPGEMYGQRPRSRACGGILACAHAGFVIIGEHSRLPPPAAARETVQATAEKQPGERWVVGRQPHDLTVKFVPARIVKALVDLGEKPWHGPRPVVVPVLTVRSVTGSYLLSADNPAGAAQRQAFADVASDFYMKVRFPTEADFAAWGIGTGRFPLLPTTTATNDALVAGTLEFQESLPGWVGSWRMRWRGVDYAWGVKRVNYDEAFRDIARGVLRVASGHGAPN